LESFDFVIVGGGSAASVLAYRLSEDTGKTVCVLEAGPPDTHPFIRMPAGFIKTLQDPRLTWQFASLPSWGTNGRAIRITQGRALGGSSSVNGTIYNRGQSGDFDGWAGLGNRGWSYREVLPYFMRTERRVGAGDDRYRGRTGRLPVTTNQLRSPVCDAFIEAARQLGLPLNPDYNGAAQEGVGYFQCTVEHGRRVSAARAFLHPARRRSVSVHTDVLATRILFDGRKAVGVAGLRQGSDAPWQVLARECVIVCAGTLNTPKLLQLSGIGPAALLREHGIAVHHELAGVGQNLRDHYTGRLVARGRGDMAGINERVRGLRLGLEVARWLLRRPSVLGLSPGVVHLFGKSLPQLAQPDYFLLFTPASYKAGYVGQLDDYPGVSCGGAVLRPQSAGYVNIASSDPRQAPLIQPNYLAEEADRQVMVAMLKNIRRLIQAAPMQRHIAGETFPGPAVSSDDEWLDFARRCGETAYHFAGTAKMGPASDPLAVVDEQLRVHGLEGLRVADASIMPTLVSANTYAATMMIGEKAADMILGRPALAPAKWDQQAF
jgi:choline dehydrogenase